MVLSFRRKVTAVLVLLVGIAAVVHAERVVIGYVNVMDDAPVHLAYEAGYYRDQGLDVELMQFASGTNLIKGIVSGRLDAGVLGFTNALAWASRGADLKIVGGAQRGYHSLLTRNDSGITSVGELRGRSLASQGQGSTADIVLSNVVLAKANLSNQDLVMRYVSPAIAVQALVSGAVDAAFLFEPYARIARYTAPVQEIFEIGDHWPFPCMVVITSGDAWTRRRSVIESVLEAQKQAIIHLETDPQGAAELITKYFIPTEYLDTPTGRIPSRQIIAEAIEANSFDWRLSSPDIARIREVHAIMRREGYLEQDVDLDSLLDISWQHANR